MFSIRRSNIWSCSVKPFPTFYPLSPRGSTTTIDTRTAKSIQSKSKSIRINSPYGKTIMTKPIHWLLDWDSTITTHDTLTPLINIAARQKPNFPVHSKWKDAVGSYMSDYDSAFNKLVPGGKLPSTLQRQKDILKALEEVEQRSIERVSAYGIFEGLTVEDLESGAETAVREGEVKIRQGYAEFLRATQGVPDEGKDPSRIDIISVNWSATFIASCLRAAQVGHPESPRCSFFANELEGIGRGVPSTGRIASSAPRITDMIISSRHKVEHFNNLREHSEDGGKTVYVGDSWTDMECLLAAEIGICVRDEPLTEAQRQLKEALDRMGMDVLRLGDVGERPVGGVVWVRDFREIVEWIKSTP